MPDSPFYTRQFNRIARRNVTLPLIVGLVSAAAAGLAGMQVAGALTIVQDPASAEVATMPEAAIRRMTPDLILPLAEIHSVLRQLGEPQ
jgi:two-component system chemotaxis response regulator CheB